MEEARREMPGGANHGQTPILSLPLLFLLIKEAPYHVCGACDLHLSPFSKSHSTTLTSCDTTHFNPRGNL